MNLRQELKRLTNQMSQESGWYETDDCDMQHCRKVTENEYDFIQMWWMDTTKSSDHEYIVVAAHINLEEEDWEVAINGYYDSLQYMQECYDGASIESLKPLIAGCAFENIYGESGYDYASGMLTKAEAEELIQKYIFLCNRITYIPKEESE